MKSSFLATAKSTSTQCCHIICHCVAFIAHSSTQLLCCCYRVALLAHSPIDHTDVCVGSNTKTYQPSLASDQNILQYRVSDFMLSWSVRDWITCDTITGVLIRCHISWTWNVCGRLILLLILWSSIHTLHAWNIPTPCLFLVSLLIEFVRLIVSSRTDTLHNTCFLYSSILHELFL